MTDWSAILARAFDKKLETGGDGGDSGDKSPKALEPLANRQAGIVTNETSQVVTKAQIQFLRASNHIGVLSPASPLSPPLLTVLEDSQSIT